MKWMLAFFGIFVSFQALATGRTVGNGGDVVVCENQSGVIESIELLDFYEGRILKGINADFGPQARTVEEKVAAALARLERVSPARAKLYRERALQFFADTLFLEDGHLADIRDAGDIVIPMAVGSLRSRINLHRYIRMISATYRPIAVGSAG